MKTFLTKWEQLLNKIAIVAMAMGLCFAALGFRLDRQLASQSDHPTGRFTVPIRMSKSPPVQYRYATPDQELENDIFENGLIVSVFIAFVVRGSLHWAKREKRET
jgi:hypothetical protein